MLPEFHLNLDNPGLVIALGLSLGMLGQVVARHLRVPGIVILLALGVAFGPDGAGIVRTESLGGALQLLVGFAVAIILFEGGLSLNLKRLRRQAMPIRRLITVGAVITTIGGALAARLFLEWDWILCFLFGTLVIVTGPTVIQPLLRRIRVKPSVATILEAEGIFGDAVGALVAVVALELVLAPPGQSMAVAPVLFLSRVAIGGLLGVLFGALLAALLKYERALPEDLRNVVALSLVLVLYQLSEGLMHESGIAAVIAAGMVVGNVRTHALEHLREFKEELTQMFVGLLFVLLAADVRIERVTDLGVGGLLTVAALMFVVRPLNVIVSTAGSDLSWREKAFLSWLAPRGIVAAAVASLFALRLREQSLEGLDLQALVFLVIAVTVVVQGLSGGFVAWALGVRPPPPSGAVILGATGLGRALARACRDAGNEAVLIDSNPGNCKAAEEEKLRVLYGSGLDETVLRRARLDDRKAAIGVIPNEDVNLSFARRVLQESRTPTVWVGLRRGHRNVTPEMVERVGGKVLFGESRNFDHWSNQLERGRAHIETWQLEGEPREARAVLERGDGQSGLLALAARRKKRGFLLLEPDLTLKTGDVLTVAVMDALQDKAHPLLADAGWRPLVEGEESEQE